MPIPRLASSLLVLSVLAVSIPAASAATKYQDVLIGAVPHVRQKPDFRGEACAAMFLQRLGRPVDQDWVFDHSGLDPKLGRGCYTKELATALQRIGFTIGPVWQKIPTARADASLETLWSALHADLVAGVPSIVCMRYDTREKTTEHFRLILGYDATSDEVIYHEPAEANGAYRRMTRQRFLSLWPLKYSQQEWTIIRMRLEPGRVKQGKVSETFTAADYAQHFLVLNKKIPREGFSVVIEHPFVVIGDERPEMVQRRAKQTVQWAVEKLKRSYFPKDPNEILDIWLFKDKESYRKHTDSIFKDDPDTPYGYYSHAERALIMNIATGGGTLVHEIVHPFMATNFPKCPSWLNEGLGSLYEQSAEVDGEIHGKTNWRLAGLQSAIRAGRVPTFKTLCTTTDHEFYSEDPGTNYAQARYLCYYLQQQGRLRKFYHHFHQKSATDPTGYASLQTILERSDMPAFQKDWERWVLTLRFP